MLVLFFTLIIYVIPGFIYVRSTGPYSGLNAALRVLAFFMSVPTLIAFNIIAGVLITAIISGEMQRMVIGTGAVTIILFALLNWFERADAVRTSLEGMENWFYLSIVVASLILVSLTISLFSRIKRIASLPINHVLIILAGISIVIPIFSLVITHPVRQVFPTIGLAGVVIGAIMVLFGALWLVHKEKDYKDPVSKHGLQK